MLAVSRCRAVSSIVKRILGVGGGEIAQWL